MAQPTCVPGWGRSLGRLHPPPHPRAATGVLLSRQVLGLTEGWAPQPALPASPHLGSWACGSWLPAFPSRLCGLGVSPRAPGLSVPRQGHCYCMSLRTGPEPPPSMCSSAWTGRAGPGPSPPAAAGGQEPLASEPVARPQPVGGEGVSGRLDVLSVSLPAPPAPGPAPAPRSGLWAPGCRLGVCRLGLAPPRGLGGESAEQQLPPQSRTVLSKSSQERDAFFSNDSAAREWEGPEPMASEDRDQGLWHEIPLGLRGEGREGGWVWGRGPGGSGGSVGAGQLQPLSALPGGLETAPSCSRGSPSKPKQTTGKWRWESRSPWRRGIQWTAAHVYVLESCTALGGPGRSPGTGLVGSVAQGGSCAAVSCRLPCARHPPPTTPSSLKNTSALSSCHSRHF